MKKRALLFTLLAGLGNLIFTSLAIAATPPIMGTFTVCATATTTLSDAGTGTWSSGSTGVATVGSASGIVTGVSGGTATITFHASTGSVTQVVTVSPLPTVPAITGVNDICLGNGTTFYDVAGGGVWISGAPGVATVSSGGGAVSSVSPGVAVIYYSVTNMCGTTTVNRSVSVDTVVTSLVVSGSVNVCQLATTTWAGSPTGGAWTSGMPSIATIGAASGVVSGVTVGTATITYQFSNACGMWTTNRVVTVDTLPSPGTISGQQVLCAGELAVLHDDQEPLGVWSSGNTAKATVMSNGYVTGVAGGTVTLSYTVTEPTYMCFKSATYVMTINALPTPSLADTGNVLSTTLGYAAYNWLNSGAYIGGATGPTYTIIMPGVYSVRVTDANGCSNNSATFGYPVTSVQNVNGANIRIYPNPTNGLISIESANSTDAQITSIDGRMLSFVSDAKQLDLRNYPGGTYILSVFDHVTGIKLTTEKIIKTGN